MRIIFSFAVTCLFFFAFTPATQAQSTASATAESVAKEMTIEVKVTGVGCSTDVRTIAGNVEKLDGVNSCTIIKKAAVTRFEVNFNPSVISAENIHQAVENTPGCRNPNSRPYQVKV